MLHFRRRPQSSKRIFACNDSYHSFKSCEHDAEQPDVGIPSSTRGTEGGNNTHRPQRKSSSCPTCTPGYVCMSTASKSSTGLYSTPPRSPTAVPVLEAPRQRPVAAPHTRLGAPPPATTVWLERYTILYSTTYSHTETHLTTHDHTRRDRSRTRLNLVLFEERNAWDYTIISIPPGWRRGKSQAMQAMAVGGVTVNS